MHLVAIDVDFLPSVLQPELQQPKRVGASIDADGKSNIWAVEPKIQVTPSLVIKNLRPLELNPNNSIIECASQVQEQQGNQLLVPAAMVSLTEKLM